MAQSILKKAEKYCIDHKHRLTDPRRAVLKIIASSKKPLGAYDILSLLSKTIKNPKPPTAYRAIEFWKKHGFVHCIESLNAYIVCDAGHQHQGSQFMICDDCGIVIEAHLCTLPKPLQNITTQNTFIPSRWNLEIHGSCADCS